jgi:hypothetical protein
MKTENQKFAESFGAVQSADGNYTLSADALNWLIESARNWGRYDETWAMPAGYSLVPNPNADFDDNQICGGMNL